MCHCNRKQENLSKNSFGCVVAQDTINSLDIYTCFLKRDQLKDFFKVRINLKSVSQIKARRIAHRFSLGIPVSTNWPKFVKHFPSQEGLTQGFSSAHLWRFFFCNRNISLRIWFVICSSVVAARRMARNSISFAKLKVLILDKYLNKYKVHSWPNCYPHFFSYFEFARQVRWQKMSSN